MATVDLDALAHSRFGELSEAERRLVLAASKGDPASCGPSMDNTDSANDPTKADNWGRGRQIRAEIIRWLCVDRDAANCVDSRGINIFAAKVVGELDLSSAIIGFSLVLQRCRCTDALYLTHTTIRALSLEGSSIQHLNMDGVDVTRDVYLRQGFVSQGGVFLRGAKIGGSLLCDNGHFKNPGGLALGADRVRVEGSVFLKDGCSAEGRVRFVSAHIGSNLEFDGGTFKNADGEAILADRAHVGGNISLRRGFIAEGKVALMGARIGGNLDCAGAVFKTSLGLHAEGARVEGNVFFRDGFNAEGPVRLFGIQIDGGLRCAKATFNLIDLRNAVIKGAFHWAQIQITGKTSLDLRNASVGTLTDYEDSWPDAGNLSLDGFVYARISEAPTDVESRLRWLTRLDKFGLQPYHQLSRVLRESGDLHGARHLLFEMEHRRRKEHAGNWLGRFWNGILRWTIGYGYKSWRALGWLTFLTLLGCLIFGGGYLGGSMVPTEKEAFQVFEQRGYPPDYYPEFNPLVYSFERSFPLVNLGVKDHWEPRPGNSDRVPALNQRVLVSISGITVQGHHIFRIRTSGILQTWLWLEILLGWAFATLFVSGLTGIVKSS